MAGRLSSTLAGPPSLHQRGFFHKMRLRGVLQLFTLLVGLCRARGAPPGDGFSSQPGEVPANQLKMLALGLGHLLRGVEDTAQRLEQQAELVGAEVDGATEGLESLREQSLQTGRIHRQVRKELQIHSARRDWLQKAVTDLQKELGDLERDQGVMQHQMNRIIQSGRSLAGPRPGGPPPAGSIRVVIGQQARRLANLTAEVSAQERILNRRLRLIEHLEEQLSSGA